MHSSLGIPGYNPQVINTTVYSYEDSLVFRLISIGLAWSQSAKACTISRVSSFKVQMY